MKISSFQHSPKQILGSIFMLFCLCYISEIVGILIPSTCMLSHVYHWLFAIATSVLWYTGSLTMVMSVNRAWYLAQAII